MIRRWRAWIWIRRTVSVMAFRGRRMFPGQATGSTVTYPGVLTDADVQLFAEDGGVKEQLVLKSADAPSTWVFPLQLTGLRAQMMANGDVAFVDESGVQQAYVPHGFMTDPRSMSTPAKGPARRR